MVELLAEISVRIGEEVVSYQRMIDRLRARQVVAPYGEWELWQPSQATRLGLQSICEAQDIQVYFKTFSERDTVKLNWNDFIQWHDAFFCGMEEGIIVPCEEPLWCIFINDGCVDGYIVPPAAHGV